MSLEDFKELLYSTSEVNVTQIVDLQSGNDLFKATKVCHDLYNINPKMFKIKFNAMISDLKMYNYINERCDGNKEMIRSIYQYISMFDFIYKKQLISKKHNKKFFGKNYIEAHTFAYEKVAELSGLTADQIRRLISKRNGYKQKVFKP